jgi:hypothetical protein
MDDLLLALGGHPVGAMLTLDVLRTDGRHTIETRPSALPTEG